MARSARAIIPHRVEHRCARRSPRRGASGFTLVEILTALAVLAIALTAALTAIGRGIDLTTTLRDRSLALWVAQERTVIHQLRHDWPDVNTTEGTMTMGGREWRWVEKVTQTDLEDMRRVDVDVTAPTDTYALASLPIFLSKPP